MKIKNEMIERFSDQYCVRYYDTNHFVTSEEVATAFFREQTTEDILEFVNRRTPQDEVYLTQAMIELAERAGFLDAWMHTFDSDGKLWEEILLVLRKQMREQRKTEKAKLAEQADQAEQAKQVE